MAGTLVCAPVAVLLAGFVWFVAALDDTEMVSVPHADGLVALTGGSERITDAVDLIATGHAERMLISGVNQAISGEEIARQSPRLRTWLDCCIDLGYDAQNTIGNAAETRRWVQAHHIRHSLIVVTSTYHMPRALLEIGRALPDMELVPYPVVSEKIRNGIWSDPQTTRMVALEYLKYLAALARTRMLPPAEALAVQPVLSGPGNQASIPH